MMRGLRSQLCLGVLAPICAALAAGTTGSSLGACSAFEAADAPQGAVDAAATPPTADGAAGSDAYRDAVMADAPIAYFRFEETAGTVAKNEVAGSSITGVLPSVGVTLGVEGFAPSSRAVQVDAADTKLNVFGTMNFAGAQPFSVEMWIQVDSGVAPSAQVDSGVDPKLASNMDFPGDNEKRTGIWLLIHATGALRTETWVEGKLLFYTEHKQAPVQLVAKKWAHIVFVYSDTLGLDVLYLNANQGEGMRGDAGTASRIAPVAPLAFGGSGFTGRIDEVAIYDKALSPQRIAAHYTAR